jgi:hypothetical protein
MAWKLAVLAVLGSLAVALVQSAAGSTASESARIAITKITVDKGGNATVRVAITGFPAARGHWDLAYTLLGTSTGFSDKVHVRRGVVAQPFTNFRSGERWKLTVTLVDNAHTKVFAKASRVFRVR